MMMLSVSFPRIFINALPQTNDPFSKRQLGKSSFARPSFLGQSVSAGQAAGGVLTGVLVGWEVGTRYAEQARQEGRNLTPEEYAKSAAESAARAVAAVLTLGGSEILIHAGTLVSETRQEWAAEEQEQQAKDELARIQREAAQKATQQITGLKNLAVSLAQQAKELKTQQDTAISEAKSFAEQINQKLTELN